MSPTTPLPAGTGTDLAMMQRKPTIFLVEDEALIAMELRDHLERFGYEVCGHEVRGEIALERIRKLRPDVILMDINLAGELSGIDTAARLGPDGHGAVVFLSAYSDPKLVSRAVNTGPFGYLVKPFNVRELHTTIEVALEKNRTERELRRARDESEQCVAGLRETLQQGTALPKDMTVCPRCHSVHTNGSGWTSLERFLKFHAPFEISYCVCLECSTGLSTPATAPSSPP